MSRYLETVCRQYLEYDRTQEPGCRQLTLFEGVDAALVDCLPLARFQWESYSHFAHETPLSCS